MQYNLDTNVEGYEKARANGSARAATLLIYLQLRIMSVRAYSVFRRQQPRLGMLVHFREIYEAHRFQDTRRSTHCMSQQAVLPVPVPSAMQLRASRFHLHLRLAQHTNFLEAPPKLFILGDMAISLGNAAVLSISRWLLAAFMITFHFCSDKGFRILPSSWNYPLEPARTSALRNVQIDTATNVRCWFFPILLQHSETVLHRFC